MVTSTPKVHEVEFMPTSITPDPVHVRINDVVAWLSDRPLSYDLCRVKRVGDVKAAFTASPVISAR